jgi:hypothetical protein
VKILFYIIYLFYCIVHFDILDLEIHGASFGYLKIFGIKEPLGFMKNPAKPGSVLGGYLTFSNFK